jgi:hypothetical protein
LEAIQKLPSDHPWCQPILQVQSGDTNKRLALRHSITHHLHFNDDDKKKRVLFIHCHHFSLLGWRNSRQKATHISANTAKQWDKKIDRRSYHDDVNSLEYIINKQLKRKVMDQEKGHYVEVPIVTRNDVRALLDSCDGLPVARASWMMIRENTEPPFSVPKKKPKISATTPGSSACVALNGGVLAMMPPVLIMKPTAVTTPTVEPLSKQEQELPLNCLFPSFDSIQSLLSHQYFVCFNGEAKQFFQSWNNVRDTLSHLLPKFGVDSVKLQHPFHHEEMDQWFIYICATSSMGNPVS